jgi:hypothetical protein
MLDAGYWMLDAGCSMLDVGCWIFDAGYPGNPQPTLVIQRLAALLQKNCSI